MKKLWTIYIILPTIFYFFPSMDITYMTSVLIFASSNNLEKFKEIRGHSPKI